MKKIILSLILLIGACAAEKPRQEIRNNPSANVAPRKQKIAAYPPIGCYEKYGFHSVKLVCDK